MSDETLLTNAQLDEIKARHDELRAGLVDGGVTREQVEAMLDELLVLLDQVHLLRWRSTAAVMALDGRLTSGAVRL
jgi:hypothetical protein